MKAWAIDLGTTNTGVAYWDDAAGQPVLVELPGVCRRPAGVDPLEAPRLVPSVVHVLDRPGFWGRLGTWPLLRRRVFIGRTALIGRPALDRNHGLIHPGFVPGFKTALWHEPLRPMARAHKQVVTARQAAREFLRELLAEARRQTGQRIRELVFTAPVESFESYRAELQAIAKSLGVRRVRFLDEPLAAALGYGLSLTTERTVLVVDIGGGTMHLALIAVSPSRVEEGEARVLGKEGRPYGGDAVDGWLLDDVCRQMGYELEPQSDSEEMRLWRRLMLAEACRVKEAVFFQDQAPFLLTPPGLTRLVDSRLAGRRDLSVTRDHLAEVLRRNDFYRALETCLDAVLAGTGGAEVDDVLMIGGSTLLPGVFPLLEDRFGRPRIRAWQPFEAVAYGAASFAARRFSQADFIVHDYAFVTHEPQTGKAVHTVVVPRGTRFPTRPDLWKRQLVPTCSLGEAESLFKLVICEIGRADGSARRFVWDAAGDLHKLGAGQDQKVVVPLNESNPTLGQLDPPHPPGNRKPRLEIAFGVNEDRWLIATVVDLWGRRRLMDQQPVVRLL